MHKKFLKLTLIFCAMSLLSLLVLGCGKEKPDPQPVDPVVAEVQQEVTKLFQHIRARDLDYLLKYYEDDALMDNSGVEFAEMDQFRIFHHMMSSVDVGDFTVTPGDKGYIVAGTIHTADLSTYTKDELIANSSEIAKNSDKPVTFQFIMLKNDAGKWQINDGDGSFARQISGDMGKFFDNK